MYTLAINPLQVNYATTNTGARSENLDGPAGHYSKEKERNVITLNLTWITDSLGFQYMRSFFRGGVSLGAAPFILNLILDKTMPSAYTVFFIPGTFTLSNRNGNVYTITAQIETLLNPIDDAAELAEFLEGL